MEEFYEESAAEQEWTVEEEEVPETASSSDTGVKYPAPAEEMHLHAVLIDGEPTKALELLDEYQFDLNFLINPSSHSSPYFKTTFLHAAAEYSTLEAVWKMVEQGADLDTLNPNGYPVLFIAIELNKNGNSGILIGYGCRSRISGF